MEKINVQSKATSLENRWVSILRQKAEYEHNARKNGEVVSSPSIDDICNEIEAFFVGFEN